MQRKAEILLKINDKLELEISLQHFTIVAKSDRIFTKLT